MPSHEGGLQLPFCAHSPVQVSENFTTPLTYSFFRPQVVEADAPGFASAPEVVEFVVLESPDDLALELSL